MSRVFYDIAPVPAPRQTRRDAFKPSSAVRAYRSFRDEIAWRRVELPGEFFHVVFMFATPRSWPRKKAREAIGQPHKQKPDADNLAKALIDGVHRFDDDAHLWNYATTKIWAGLSGILIADEYLDLTSTPVDVEKLIDGAVSDYYKNPLG